MTALRGVAALLTVGASLVVAPVPAAAAQADDQQAVQNYAGCLNGRRAGDLLLLIDESGSLGNPVRGRPPTDPDGQRVRAAKYLLTQLADRADRAGITIDVQIAGFATEFDRNPSAWTALTPTTLADLTKKVDDFATRDSGQDTDYWTALNGARASLADHRTVDAGEAGRCQAVAWFSDGGLDITAATAQQRRSDGSAAPTTNEDAQEALCAPSGTAEQLRRANVVMFGIGLAPPGTPENEFDLMRSITTGRTDDGSSCGTTTDPAPGTFTPAADIDELIPAFDQILGRPDIVGSPTDVCIQADATCRGQEFVLDGSIDSVNVLGQADIAAAGLTAELVGPDGERVELSVKDAGRTNELRLGAASGDYSWQSERTVVINLDYPKGPDASGNAPGWSGVWALRFVAPQAAGKSTTNIRVSGNIEPVWTDARPSLPTGQDQEIRLSLGKIDKTPVDPGSIKGTYRLSAAIVDPASGRPLEAPRALAEDTTGPVTLPLRAVPEGQLALRLTLDLTTAPATRRDTGERVPGTRLAPAIVDIPLLVEPPPGYPVLPPRLDFGAASDGATELTARMAVRGPGCVWVPAEPAPTVTTLPTGTGSVTVAADDFTSSQACLSLADGQTGDVIVHLRADHAGNGTATGTLPVSIAPPNRPDQARTVDIAFTGDLRSPLNPVNFWLTLIVALLLGPGIPLGLLYLVKWATARIPARGLYARTIPVTVEGGRTMRDGAPFQFRDDDFVALADVPAGGARRLVVDDVVLRTRTGRSPFGSGYVSVEPAAAGTGLACLAPGDTHPRGYRLTTRLPLAVHGSWVVLHDPAGPAEEARVLVLLGADTSAPGRARLADDIADRLPTVLDRLRTILEEWGRRDRPAGGGPAPPSSPGSSGGAAQAPPPSFGPSHLAGAHRPTADTGSGAQFGPPSDPGPSYGPTYDAGTDPPQWGRRVTDPAGGTTSPLPAGDDADDPDVPQSWRPTADPGSGPPTYGPRG